jgi:tetratricopeptide (TPR) repeat protein
MKRIFSFLAAACLAWPCFAAAPEAPMAEVPQNACVNADLVAPMPDQIEACVAAANNPDLSKEARAQAFLQLGQSYLRGMMYDRALAAFNAAIRLTPQSGAAFGGRGKAHIARDEIYQGIADLDYALRLDDTLDLHAERGAALVKVGKPDEAAADFTQALARRPNDATLWAQRGVEEFKAGNPAQAEADLERALTLDPSLVRHPTYGPFISEFVRPIRR